MSLPKFKPAKHFLGEYNLPCRLSKVKNSRLPGLATRAIAISKEDPICEIYLHGKGVKKFSGWEKEILEQLFDGRSLAVIVESAMKEHAKTPEGYADAKPGEREEIRKIGIAPFMTIYRIVIDGSRKEAILCARTLLDLNLIEHGINFFLKKGKWRFSDDQHYIRYADKLGPTLEEEEEEDESPTSEEKRYAKLFPPAKRGTPVEKNPTVLFGKWKFDKARTRKISLALGHSKERMNFTLDHNGGNIMEFTPKTVTYSKVGIKPLWTSEVVSSERRGNWIIVRRLIRAEVLWTMTFWLDDKGLVDAYRIAYQRVE